MSEERARRLCAASATPVPFGTLSYDVNANCDAIREYDRVNIKLRPPEYLMLEGAASSYERFVS